MAAPVDNGLGPGGVRREKWVESRFDLCERDVPPSFEEVSDCDKEQQRLVRRSPFAAFVDVELANSVENFRTCHSFLTTNSKQIERSQEPDQVVVRHDENEFG